MSRLYQPRQSICQRAVNQPGVSKVRIVFQSSNAWDAVAAAHFGFRVAWCDRYGQRLERMKPVLRYAEKLTRNPSGVTKGDAETIFTAGWNETALYHTVAVTALFNFMNRLIEGLGIELTQSYVEQASRRLAERGYLPLVAMLDQYQLRRSSASILPLC